MSESDREAFRRDVAEREANRFYPGGPVAGWGPAAHSASRLSMTDLLPALNSISQSSRDNFAEQARHILDWNAYRRLAFALTIIGSREIVDVGLPEDQVNVGRLFLGCTPLQAYGVRQEIDSALSEARAAIAEPNEEDGRVVWASGVGDAPRCCGVHRVAWAFVLVPRRRSRPNASLTSNLAAAAHYMLARFHVCSALTSDWQTRIVIDGYDERKRRAIAGGDRDMRTIALDPTNRPFPPDFGIREWAYRGITDGEQDRQRCNTSTPVPTVMPVIDDLEWGIFTTNRRRGEG